MRVLITGASGQLGREFEFLAPKFPQFQFTFKDKNELDICDLKACEREILGFCTNSRNQNLSENSQIPNLNLSENSIQNPQNPNLHSNLSENLSQNPQNQIPNLSSNSNTNFNQNSQIPNSNSNLSKNSSQNPSKIPPNFDAVINAAAYTAVDRAESERERAFAVNEKGVANLAKVCKIGGAKLIHISTDYVFSGEFSAPIKTDTPPSPINAYGESKLGGERAILAADLRNCAIIRTSWLYGAFGGNFVKTIARHAREKNAISVVCDQLGSPTNARDLALAVLEVLPNLSGKTQILHYSNEGATSWCEFAREILRILGLCCEVKAIQTREYPTPAKRPAYSVLDLSEIKAKFKLQIPPWQESLKRFLSENLGKI